MKELNKEIQYYFQGEKSLEEILLELIVIKKSNKPINKELR